MNFADIDFAVRRGPPAWAVVGLGILLALLSWGGYRCVRAEQAIEAAQAQFNLQRQRLAREAAAPVSQAPLPGKERVKAVNEAVASLNVPWPAVLGSIETARPATVALIRVEPRPKDQTVLVTAQADEMAALLDFMAVVSKTAPFIRMQPVRQESVVDAGMPRKQATFEASWEAAP